jgi:hypothetical protein
MYFIEKITKNVKTSTFPNIIRSYLMASLDESLLVRKENNAILQKKKSPILF